MQRRLGLSNSKSSKFELNRHQSHCLVACRSTTILHHIANAVVIEPYDIKAPLSDNLLLSLAVLRHYSASARLRTMPQTIIRGSRAADGTTQKRGPTFTGDVWADPILSNSEEGITIGHVTFTPCARTHWHQHEDGQVLEVKAGTGWVCEKGGQPQRLNVGDIVWAPPWHDPLAWRR